LTDALTHGVHHVGLAVRDLDEATGFFCGTLGFKEVARNDAYPAVFVSDWQRDAHHHHPCALLPCQR
jgi:catechol 2,3-dioxygenase-like lactoylglutathione lyase family enzyme